MADASPAKRRRTRRRRNPDAQVPFMDIHYRCYSWAEVEGRMLMCGKSAGHSGMEHFDPSADKTWRD